MESPQPRLAAAWSGRLAHRRSVWSSGYRLARACFFESTELVKSTRRVSEVGESDGCLGKAGSGVVVSGHTIFHSGVTPNKSLVLTAHAAFFCVECLVGVGLVGQVGVKSKLLCGRRGVFM